MERMDERSKPPVLVGSLSSVARRVSSVGVAAGFLLLALSGPTPERLQLAVACSGIALALLSAGALVSLTAHPALRWKGVSPALGMVLGVIVGALPGLLSGVWLQTESQPVARPAVIRAAARPRHDMPATVTMRVVPPDNVAAPAPPAAKPPGPVLNELSYVLDRKARPALDSLHRLLASVADAPESMDPVTLTSELEPGMNELAEVAASLERIQAENPDLSPELRQAIEGSRALSTLNSALHQLSLSQGDARGYGAPRLRRLANATESASRWVDGMDQQLARSQTVTRQASR
jgi:hypothetical protein